MWINRADTITALKSFLEKTEKTLEIRADGTMILPMTDVFQGQKLEGMDFHKAVLIWVNFQEARLQWSSFEGSKLDQAIFCKAIAPQTDFSYTSAEGTDFSEACLFESTFIYSRLNFTKFDCE